MTSDPGTVATLHVVVFDSLIDVFRGSMAPTPFTPNTYRYAPGSTTPVVISHTPLSPLVNFALAPADAGRSEPRSVTVIASGASSRNTIRRSGRISGEVTAGGGDPAWASASAGLCT